MTGGWLFTGVILSEEVAATTDESKDPYIAKNGGIHVSYRHDKVKKREVTSRRFLPAPGTPGARACRLTTPDETLPPSHFPSSPTPDHYHAWQEPRRPRRLSR